MAKGRVCILTTAHSPFDTRIFYKQARSLEQAGYQVVIIAPYQRSESRGTIKILGVTPPKNRVSRMIILPFRLIKKALQQGAEIYHIHDPDLLPAAWFIKKFTPSKIIYDVHENYAEVIKSRSWMPALLRPILSTWISLIERALANSLDGIVAVTEDIQDLFNVRHAVLVRNYPRLDLVKPERNLDVSSLQKDSVKLIYVGDLTRVRGIVEIVKSMEYLDPASAVELVLVGGYSEQDLEGILRSLKGFERVNHLGRVPYSAVADHLLNADVGLVCLHPLPRYKKSLPVKMFEYMAAGLPVVASDFPTWRAIIEDCQCGVLVDPESPEDIAERILSLVENPDLRLRMGQNGLMAVREKYNWSSEEKKLLGIYHALLQA